MFKGFLLLVFVVGLFCAIFACARPSQTQSGDSPPLRWWKGNLHCHTLASDGNHYPEMVADWYKKQGYHFLAITDHDNLCQGKNESAKEWIDAADEREPGLLALNQYRERFGEQWVEEREEEGKRWVRLKPLREFRHRFEEAGRFLLIQGEEITNREENHVHVNAINLREAIPPRSGPALEVIDDTVSAIVEQSKRVEMPMLAQVNHPNFKWGIAPENLVRMKESPVFEVYNAHPGVANPGDAFHIDTDRMWDIVLTRRIAEFDKPPILATATDDAHNYFEFDSSKANPGHGWVVVRAPFLTPDHIVRAMQAGDFYASTGVSLNDIRFDGRRIEIRIDPDPEVTYATQFIGTRKGYDRSASPAVDSDGKPFPDRRRYSKGIGEVLAQVDGTSPSYRLQGDEIYVRARIVSSQPKKNPRPGEQFEVAWTQPFTPTNQR